ncbi:MAG: SH3 domain-containing protein [Anaerolineales bacterium]|nr:SH3 domain-containing protein [Anaerolineales bacterium]
MSLPKTDQFPDDPEDLTPSRRRRADRGLVPEDLVSIAEDIENLAHSTIPSFDFFLFSLLAAAIITASILADSPALLVLGALAAPPLTPFIGISLGTATGSLKFFGQRFAGSIVASGFVFLVGILGGYATFVLKTPGIQFLIYNARVSWTHFILLIAGTVFSIFSIKRQGQIPVIASIALAYELYVPLAIAGFGFGSGQPHLWPDGLVVFGIHLAVLAITGTIVFMLLGIKPLSFLGYTLGSVVAILAIVMVIGLSSAGAIVSGKIAMPTLVHTATLTPTPVPPTYTPTVTPIPPTFTPSPTVPTATSTPLPTATPTITPKPTPFYAEIAVSEEYAGAYIRSEPSLDSQRLTSLVNGTVIEILNPSPSYDEQGRNWLNIRYSNEDGDERDGWVIENLLLISTPQPEW